MKRGKIFGYMRAHKSKIQWVRLDLSLSLLLFQRHVHVNQRSFCLIKQEKDAITDVYSNIDAS